MRFWIIIYLLCFSLKVCSQKIHPFKSGISLHLIFSFGSHQKSVGIRLNSYFQYRFFQLNGSSLFQFYKFSWGNRSSFFENANAIGIVGFVGQKNQFVDWEFSVLSKQSPHDYAISYSSIWYRDNAGTSQRSGAFGLQIKKISLSHENDAFAGIATDRFRTGIFKVSWNDSLYKIGSGIFIWTGETNGVPKQFNPEFYPKYYKNLSMLPYGKTSHGILYGQVQFRMQNNSLGFQIGVDSEELRHQIQNEFFHDLPFLPKKYQNQTPHYPRLNDQGFPTFDKNGIRKNRFYYSVGINSF